MTDNPLIVIVGQTASGKSALGLELAQKFDGEIICADSRTVYKGMDIGTAKPSAKDRKIVKHHLLDIIEPDQRFTAATFKELANASISDIQSRGKLPIMVGGTGLYIDSVLFDFKFSPKNAGRDPQNPRHLKDKLAADRSGRVRPNTLTLGFNIEPDVLKERIESRVRAMIEEGLESEARYVAEKYGWDAPGLNAIGYLEWRSRYADAQEIAGKIISSTKDYAKRQKTWFKRNKSIQWVNDPSKAVDIATTFLYKN